MVVTAFCVIRGILRGTVAQVFAFSGVLLGVLAAAAVADAVGTHWRSARPELVFTSLRWLVASLTGLGVAALMGFWGGVLAKAVHDGPFGWLDRAVGGFIGLVIGTVTSTAIVVLLLLAPGLEFARPVVARGAIAPRLVDAGRSASEWSKPFPGGLWLHEQLSSASRRLATRRPA